MKKIGKYILWIVVTLVVLIDVLLTVYLLNYNQYNVAEFGNKTVLIMNGKLGVEDFKKGDLVVVNKTANKEIRTNDAIFFYYTGTNDQKDVVYYSKVKMVNSNPNGDNTFIMPVRSKSEKAGDQSMDYLLAQENVIGRADDVKVYPAIGAVIGLLSSKWVFLFAVILPILVLFLYQLYLLLQELKRAKK